ncbi:BCCT family transporter [Sporosarcina pasteurii]|uniref:Glycine betaine transporter BetP n=1 Tax=Sporosarcina pasteurii TaxID=1474 RepID=A0A380BDR4_SPOPA|nr:BCCT family transporter [Sporosarcina pasteurii]MDS9472449.1 BCCT family transporter [Sporosarcina pasteurii]QBQ06006.1 BCCT family transporter [Sporosarcina pasteurii]SUI99677.1 Glycine betaine transporter BetP [Sporosarcina pasteurii]
MKGKKTVFYSSLAVSLALISVGVFAPKQLENFSESSLSFIYNNLGWFILGSVFIFFAFSIYLGLSKFGHIRLGDDDDRPEYKTGTWIGMLFSASIGISLVFWGVAEPVSYYITPPYGKGYSEDSAKLAMQFVYLHWGVSAWACYAVVGVSLAFFQFRKKLPTSLSSVFYPILGDKIRGSFGKFIDVIVILSIVIGIATSLGFGTLQVNSGLNYLWGIPISYSAQAMIILIVSLIYIGSTVSGLQGAMKHLSNLNMLLAFVLLAFVFFLGPTQMIMKIFLQGISDYTQNFVSMSFRTEPYSDGTWIASWTLFYFGWWIAWSPLVGSFVARISKGRTIKEFMIGAIFIPVLGSFFWFAVMGGSAIDLIQNVGHTALATAVSADVTSALFLFFDYFPMGAFLSVLAMVLVLVFFITSANSAVFVLGMISENGEPNPSHFTKIVWGIIIAIISAVLIMTGGLSGLQSILVATSIPLAILLLVMCYSTYKGLKDELALTSSEEPKGPINKMSNAERQESILSIPKNSKNAKEPVVTIENKSVNTHL